MDQDQPRSKPGSLIDSLFTALLALVLAWMVYHLMIRPALPRMRIVLFRSFTRVTSVLARRTAALSMRRELEWGIEDYWLPYRLSLLRDRHARAARKAEEAMRP